MTQIAPAEISAGMASAAGEALHRLPPTLARLWIWIPPMIRALSALRQFAPPILFGISVGVLLALTLGPQAAVIFSAGGLYGGLLLLQVQL